MSKHTAKNRRREQILLAINIVAALALIATAIRSRSANKYSTSLSSSAESPHNTPNSNAR